MSRFLRWLWGDPDERVLMDKRGYSPSKALSGLPPCEQMSGGCRELVSSPTKDLRPKAELVTCNICGAVSRGMNGTNCPGCGGMIVAGGTIPNVDLSGPTW